MQPAVMVSSCCSINTCAAIGGDWGWQQRRRRRKRRVVIIGAGMAGLSAAHHLIRMQQMDADLELELEGGASKEQQQQQEVETPWLEVIVVEASDRIGGRIWSSEMGGDRVEMGATWIQGVEGSPVYAMAMAASTNNSIEGEELQEKKKKKKVQQPFECQDGFPADPPIVKAEGGETVDPSVVEPVMALYDKLLAEIRSMNMEEAEYCGGRSSSSSIGSVVRQGFEASSFFEFNYDDDPAAVDDDTPAEEEEEMMIPSTKTKWKRGWLQEAALRTKENMERVDTAADSILDLDVRGEREYREYPGEHVTIAAGYSSVVHKLAASLPRHALHFNKQVQTIYWNYNRNHHSASAATPNTPSSQSPSSSSYNYPVLISCADGSLYEADHVIITVSLGVLKASIQQQQQQQHDESNILPSSLKESLQNKKNVCRSIYDSSQIHRISSPLLDAPASASFVPAFFPPLPPWKALAISKLGYGVVDKLFLRLNPRASLSNSSRRHLTTSHFLFLYHPRIPSASSSSIPWWMRRTFSLAPVYKGSSVLLLWFAGAEALEMEGLSDEEVMSGVEKTMAEFGVLKQKKPAKGGKEDGMHRPAGGSIDGEFEDNNEEDDESSGSDVGGGIGGSPMFSSSAYSSSSSSSSSIAAAEQSSFGSDSEQEIGYEVEITSVAAAELQDGGGTTTTNTNHKKKRSAAAVTDVEEPLFSQVMRSRWGRDPLYRGSYSYVATGASGEDIDALAAPLPELPSLQLLFAGEATERQMYSTTHGAYLSGLREATRLLHHHPLHLPLVNASTSHQVNGSSPI